MPYEENYCLNHECRDCPRWDVVKGCMDISDAEDEAEEEAEAIRLLR